MKEQDGKIVLVRAAALRDAAGVDVRGPIGLDDGCVVAVRGGKVAYAGLWEDLPGDLQKGKAREIDARGKLITPAHVNGHVHLDLTSVGPQPFSGRFGEWLMGIRDIRIEQAVPIAVSVEQGVRLSREAGVGYAADIAGSIEALDARRKLGDKQPLPGVSYVEWYGAGEDDEVAARMKSQESWTRELEYETPVSGAGRGILVGVQPHAPYSARREVFDRAVHYSQEYAYRLCTHLAESLQELELLREGTGEFAELLKGLSQYDATFTNQGAHPVDYFAEQLENGRWLLAHCNYLNDRHIDLLAKTGSSVAYCPVASEYFEHGVDTNEEDEYRGGRHRYREMIDAGVNVCLGVDSMICQPVDEKQPMGILPQMRKLWQRDGLSGSTAAEMLLKMATVNGMLGMELPEGEVTLGEGGNGLFCAVEIDVNDDRDALVQVLEHEQVAELIEALPD